MPSLRIRHATEADLPAIRDIYNEAIANSTATFDTEPKDLDERRAWLARHGQTHPVLVAEEGGEVLGWASLSPWSDRCAYSGTAENSVYVAPGARGRGIGRQLLAATVVEARRAGLHTILARITSESDVSIALHEALGFVRTGTLREVGRKFGRLLDVHMYQIIL